MQLTKSGISSLSLILPLLFITSPSLAETYLLNGNIYNARGDGFVELGGATTSDLFKGQKTSSSVLFDAGYRGYDFNIDLSGMNYRFLGDDGDIFNASVYLARGVIGYDSGDASILNGMDSRDTSADIGLNGDLVLGGGMASLFFQHDVTDNSDGFVSGVKYAYVLNVASAEVVPFASYSYFSEDVVDYYYGVKPSESTSQRSEYKGKAGSTISAGYKVFVPLSSHFNLVHSAAYLKLSDEMSDSPLIDSDSQWILSISAAYHF